MVRRICLDSDVLIALLNDDQPTKEIVESLDADFYTTAINSFELWQGRKKVEPVFGLLSSLHQLALHDIAARLAADILRELKAKGKILDLRDLFIASLCINEGIELLTYNTKHFERLKEFGLILVEHAKGR